MALLYSKRVPNHKEGWEKAGALPAWCCALRAVRWLLGSASFLRASNHVFVSSTRPSVRLRNFFFLFFSPPGAPHRSLHVCDFFSFTTRERNTTLFVTMRTLGFRV